MDFSILQQFNFKKILLIILFLALCFGLGFGIYYLFFHSPEPGPGEPGFVGQGGTLPNANNANNNLIGAGTGAGGAGDSQGAGGAGTGNAGLKGEALALPITADKVVSPILSNSNNGIIFYNPLDNKFYNLNEAGEKIPISNQEFYQVQNVYWSADKNQAIIEYPDGNKILYDFIKNKQLTLKKEINEPEFNSTGQVAYKHLTNDTANNWLAVTNVQGSETNLIEPLGDNENEVQIAWSPTGEVAALFAKPVGNDKTEVFFIGLKEENFKSLIVDGSNFKGLWSPSGARLLYHAISGQNNYNPMLWIADAEGETIGNHKFSLGLSTWIDKCAFQSEKILYCAVPRELPEGAGLYPELITDTEDLIYKIDLSTGLKDLIAEPADKDGNKFNIEKLYITDKEDYIFFLNKRDGRVYKIELK